MDDLEFELKEIMEKHNYEEALYFAVSEIIDNVDIYNLRIEDFKSHLIDDIKNKNNTLDVSSYREFCNNGFEDYRVDIEKIIKNYNIKKEHIPFIYFFADYHLNDSYKYKSRDKSLIYFFSYDHNEFCFDFLYAIGKLNAKGRELSNQIIFELADNDFNNITESKAKDTKDVFDRFVRDVIIMCKNYHINKNAVPAIVTIVRYTADLIFKYPWKNDFDFCDYLHNKLQEKL